MADPLSFLNVENPLVQMGRFSGLAGQKASLMERYKPGKQSVGLGAAKGLIGGAIAGATLDANMGKSTVDQAGSEDYGNRTAPTVGNAPYAGNASAIQSANVDAQMAKDRGNEIMSYTNSNPTQAANRQMQTDYDDRWSGKSSYGIWQNSVFG